MGAIVLVPEGESDFEWLRCGSELLNLLNEVAAQCSRHTDNSHSHFRCCYHRYDCGNRSVFVRTRLHWSMETPMEWVHYFTGASYASPDKDYSVRSGRAVECLSAWMLEPALCPWCNSFKLQLRRPLRTE